MCENVLCVTVCTCCVFQSRWAGLQKDVAVKREALTDVAPRWYEFSRCHQDLVHWFQSMERQLDKGDIRDWEVRPSAPRGVCVTLCVCACVCVCGLGDEAFCTCVCGVCVGVCVSERENMCV